jgi:hypothetical protein
MLFLPQQYTGDPDIKWPLQKPVAIMGINSEWIPLSSAIARSTLSAQ